MDETLGGHLTQPVIYRKKTLKIHSFIHKYVLSAYYLGIVLSYENRQ